MHYEKKTQAATVTDTMRSLYTACRCIVRQRVCDTLCKFNTGIVFDFMHDLQVRDKDCEELSKESISMIFVEQVPQKRTAHAYGTGRTREKLQATQGDEKVCIVLHCVVRYTYHREVWCDFVGVDAGWDGQIGAV